MNIVPRKFQGQKPEGPQAPRVFSLGTFQGTIFTRIPPRLFHILPFFCNPALVTGILLQPILPLGSIVVNSVLQGGIMGFNVMGCEGRKELDRFEARKKACKGRC